MWKENLEPFLVGFKTWIVSLHVEKNEEKNAKEKLIMEWGA